MRSLGIDPGSKSIDLCGLCDGEVCFEEVVDTLEAARSPERVLEAIERAGEVDVVAAPSGYGLEVTRLSDVPPEVFEDFYYTFVLAATREEIERAASRGIAGAGIYYAMAKIAAEMRRRGLPAVLIPGVVNLPTVPVSRKLNRVDMGTADKLAVAALGVHEVSEEHGIPYDRVDYVHVEMGFGYSAVMAVRGGRVVDGIGGTTMPGPAFLTSGALDLETVQAVSSFEKSDVFTSGCAGFTGKGSPEEWIESAEGDPESRACFEAMVEGVVRAVYSMLYHVRRPLEVLLSGRLARHPKVFKTLEEVLGGVAPVRLMRGLGAGRVKETAQGYAVVASGLAGGPFRELVKHMGIDSARGSSLDYIVLPRFFESPLGRKYLELRGLLRSPALNVEWWRRAGARGTPGPLPGA